MLVAAAAVHKDLTTSCQLDGDGRRLFGGCCPRLTTAQTFDVGGNEVLNRVDEVCDVIVSAVVRTRRTWSFPLEV